METGGCRRDHLEQAAKTGFRSPQLDLPPFPSELSRAWIWFHEIALKRQVAATMGGIIYQPIGHGELESWCRYTGERPTYLERRAIDILDLTYIQVFSKRG